MEVILIDTKDKTITRKTVYVGQLNVYESVRHMLDAKRDGLEIGELTLFDKQFAYIAGFDTKEPVFSLFHGGVVQHFYGSMLILDYGIVFSENIKTIIEWKDI